MLLAISASIIIGILLGLLGGGGSILTVPMLVYLLHIEPKMAIVTSFIVVGLSSVIAMIPHARRHSVCWKSGLAFGLSGMLGAFVAGRLAAHFSSDCLMALFGSVSLFTGLLMFKSGKSKAHFSTNKLLIEVCPLKVPFFRMLFDGFLVGSLTGMVGVGGGFMIVPALSILVGLPMQGAVGTSLLIIFMNAVAGLLGYSTHVNVDLHLTMLVAAGSIIGSGFGAWLSGYVNAKILRKLFSVLVISVAVYVLFQSLTQSLLDSVMVWFAQPLAYVWFGMGCFSVLFLLLFGKWLHKKDRVFFNELSSE